MKWPDMMTTGAQRANMPFLAAMTAAFAMLALDIAVPAVVLSLMAFLRWIVLPTSASGERTA